MKFQDMRAEFTPQLEEIKAMARQDVASPVSGWPTGGNGVGLPGQGTREGPGYHVRIGVVLGWLIKRP